MSWSPDLFIGELRPWPDSVDVVRGKYDESRRYVPEEERDMYRDLVGNMVHPDIPDQLYAENAKLRELVEDMLDCMEIREAFGRPPTSEMCEEFAQRAGELGIEVDE